MLQFLTGPLKGKAVPLTRSITIGRKGTDVEIDDPKLSQIHAFIQTKDNKTWTLIDNGSRNGLESGGKRINKMVIEDGSEFSLGETKVHCQLQHADHGKASDGLSKWVAKSSRKLKNANNQMKEIFPQMNLRFVEGVQYGTLWEIFYAPRAIGSANLDLALIEDNLPESVIIIDSIDSTAFLRTKHSHLVRVNGEHVDTKTLKDGDIIEVGESKIMVEMMNDKVS